jgi:hypothetical protein
MPGKMDKKMRNFEKSAYDKKVDRAAGLKEGSKADKKIDNILIKMSPKGRKAAKGK